MILDIRLCNNDIITHYNIRFSQLKLKTRSLRPTKSGHESNQTHLSFIRLCVYDVIKLACLSSACACMM